VVAELAVARQRDEAFDQGLDVVETMRPLRMARDLRLLPWGQCGIEIAQLLDLGLELRHRLLEIEVGSHVRETGPLDSRMLGRSRSAQREQVTRLIFLSQRMKVANHGLEPLLEHMGI